MSVVNTGSVLVSDISLPKERMVCANVDNVIVYNLVVLDVFLI